MPCKKEFPHLVEMHKTYASQGVAFMSVSIDPAKKQQAVLDFLRKQGATFTNVLIDEPPNVWQEMFDAYGVPTTLVFDRDGKMVARFEGPAHAKLEVAVKKLL